jgi:putative ABC transport system ATP-binding protein
MMQEILKVENAVKHFGSGNATTKALDGVSFSMLKGEFVAVMGASGSGKSTLLNVISTIEPLSKGEIYIDGEAISSLKEKELAAFRRDKLGFVFQEYNLLDTLTIEENIVLPLNLVKVDHETAHAQLERVSSALGVTDQWKKFPYELSGGQRQRAACARAVITNPALVLADEPTGALDSQNSRILMEQFRHINKEFGSTILMVTHDAVMGSYADRVLFLRDGKIFSELKRGDKERKEFYQEILSLTASSGGEEGGEENVI